MFDNQTTSKVKAIILANSHIILVLTQLFLKKNILSTNKKYQTI